MGGLEQAAVFPGLFEPFSERYSAFSNYNYECLQHSNERLYEADGTQEGGKHGTVRYDHSGKARRMAMSSILYNRYDHTGRLKNYQDKFRKVSEYIVWCYDAGLTLFNSGGNDNQQTQNREQQQQNFGGSGQQQPSPREEIHEQELNHHQVLDVIEEQKGGHDKQHETVHETMPEPMPEHGEQQESISGDKSMVIAKGFRVFCADAVRLSDSLRSGSGSGKAVAARNFAAVSCGAQGSRSLFVLGGIAASVVGVVGMVGERNTASHVIRKAALETTRPTSTGSKHVYLSMAELKAILTLPEFLPNSPNGLFWLVVLFCMNFFLNFFCLKFNQRVSKNYEVDLMNCKNMDQQPAVDLYEIAAPLVYKFEPFSERYSAFSNYNYECLQHSNERLYEADGTQEGGKHGTIRYDHSGKARRMAMSSILYNRYDRTGRLKNYQDKFRKASEYIVWCYEAGLTLFNLGGNDNQQTQNREQQQQNFVDTTSNMRLCTRLCQSLCRSMASNLDDNELLLALVKDARAAKALALPTITSTFHHCSVSNYVIVVNGHSQTKFSRTWMTAARFSRTWQLAATNGWMKLTGEPQPVKKEFPGFLCRRREAVGFSQKWQWQRQSSSGKASAAAAGQQQLAKMDPPSFDLGLSQNAADLVENAAPFLNSVCPGRNRSGRGGRGRRGRREVGRQPFRPIVPNEEDENPLKLELSHQLALFYKHVLRDDGKPYPPTTLRDMNAASHGQSMCTCGWLSLRQFSHCQSFYLTVLMDCFEFFLSQIQPTCFQKLRSGSDELTDNWYCRVARIGEHKISEVVKLVAEKTGLSLSAKDIRHSAITTMSVCNTPMKDYMKLMGHKRVENMEQYDHSGKARRMAMSSILYNRYDHTGRLKNYQDKFRKASEYIVWCYEAGLTLFNSGGNDNQQTQNREQQQQNFGGSGQQQPSPREEIHEKELNHHQVLDVIEEQWTRQATRDYLDDNELLLALAKDPRAVKALALPTITSTFHHCSNLDDSSHVLQNLAAGRVFCADAVRLSDSLRSGNGSDKAVAARRQQQRQGSSSLPRNFAAVSCGAQGSRSLFVLGGIAVGVVGVVGVVGERNAASHNFFYLKFNQRVSKNYEVDLMNCKNMDQQPAVDLYEIAAPSVYKAFKLFFDKHPTVGDGEDLNKRPFFLACNDCFNRTDNWYCRVARIGEHKISEVVKLVAKKTGLSLSAKDIRHSAITTMSVCNTPMKDYMKLMGHKRVENMEQYDHSGKARRMAMSSILYNWYDHTGRLKNYQDKFQKASEYIVRCYEAGLTLFNLGGNDNQQTQNREQQQQNFGGFGQQQPSPREEIHEQELNHHQVLDVIEEHGHDKQHEIVHKTVPELVPEHGEQQESISGDKDLDDNELLLALAKDPRAVKALALPTITSTFHHCSPK
ncbi:hypothetical protein SELMODRAFT_409570 [Selaginella moellendorffii]|uniref:Tyr recombinase domain-containing protein n=1 Tax=Selaginella moellendorffii TaxID=88036 RepID=D8RBV8_SELML|nr:hypothetical protein SELMODRAFT_409570 [Selaginella moellendorffii]